MKLLSLELKNICQHQYLNINFNTGLTAVIGPNGSGKSNLLASIYAGITNDFSRFRATTRDKIISQFAKDTDPSYIKVTLEHNNNKAVLLRDIRNSKRELTINDQQTIYSDKEISDTIEKWFNLSLKTIGQYIFVDQWAMFSILDASSSEKMKDLYRLFGIDKAETCYTLLNDKISNISLPLPPIDPDVVRPRLLSSRNQLRDLLTQIENINKTLLEEYEPSKDHNHKIIEDWNLVSKLQLEFDKYYNELTELKYSYSQNQHVLQSYETKLIKLETNLASQLNTKTEADIALANWSMYSKIELQKDQLSKHIIHCEHIIKDLIKPVKPSDYVSFKNPVFANSYNGLKTSIQECTTYLEKTKDCAVCPTCGIESSKFEYIRESRIKELASYEKYLLELDKSLRSSQIYDRKLKDYQTKYDHYLNDLSASTSQLESLQSLDKPTITKELAEACISRYTKLRTELAQNLKVKESLLERINQQQGSITSLTSTLAFKEKQLETIKVTQDEYDLALTNYKNNQDLYSKRKDLRSRIQILIKSISDDELSLMEAKTILEKKAKLENWRQDLIQVKGIFSKNNLPNNIAQSHLHNLESKINQNLQDLGVDFRTKVEDQLRFSISFQDGRVIDATSLSGGEKVVFALAWRLAVNSSFATDIGLICLDEPTAGLDKDRLTCLKLALDKLRQTSESTGLQCLVITHETNLISQFDNIIELKPIFN